VAHSRRRISGGTFQEAHFRWHIQEVHFRRHVSGGQVAHSGTRIRRILHGIFYSSIV